MADYMTVSDTARLLETQYHTTVPPRVISDLLYQRVVPDNVFPVVGGRRLIPRKCLPLIVDALRDKGMLKADSLNESPTPET